MRSWDGAPRGSYRTARRARRLPGQITIEGLTRRALVRGRCACECSVGNRHRGLAGLEGSGDEVKAGGLCLTARLHGRRDGVRVPSLEPSFGSPNCALCALVSVSARGPGRQDGSGCGDRYADAYFFAPALEAAPPTIQLVEPGGRRAACQLCRRVPAVGQQRKTLRWDLPGAPPRAQKRSFILDGACLSPPPFELAQLVVQGARHSGQIVRMAWRAQSPPSSPPSSSSSPSSGASTLPLSRAASSAFSRSARVVTGWWQTPLSQT